MTYTLLQDFIYMTQRNILEHIHFLHTLKTLKMYLLQIIINFTNIEDSNSKYKITVHF